MVDIGDIKKEIPSVEGPDIEGALAILADLIVYRILAKSMPLGNNPKTRGEAHE